MTDRQDAVQAERRARIEDAAHALLVEQGYRSTSLLAVAKRAGASNETLYKWYGNKQGLFAALVAANADKARAVLAAADGGDPLQRLARLGPVLLAMVTGEKAVALNRAAAADASDTGTLGPALARLGRDVIAPLIGDLLRQADDGGLLGIDDPAEAADVYLRLLIGDLQVRRVIGAIAAPDGPAITARARQALEMFQKLYPAAAAGQGTSNGEMPP